MAAIRILVIHNLTIGYWLKKGVIEILMFQSAGTGKLLSFVFWFASAMAMASFFVYFLRLWNAAVCNAIFPVVALGIYSAFLQKYGTFNVNFTYNFLFSDGFWRALAGIMTGCLCYEVIRYLKRFDLSGKKLLFSVIEALLLVVILFALCKTRYREKNYTVTLLLGVFLILLFSQTSHLSDLLNNGVSRYLGKISYAIYLNQVLVYTVFFGRFSVIVRTYPRKATLVYLVCVVVLSVITTWVVDKLGDLVAAIKSLLKKRHSTAV